MRYPDAMASEATNRAESPLRRDRREQGKRLVDVAKEAGCSTGLVSMVESGYVPSPAMQRGIAAALGASVERYWPS